MTQQTYTLVQTCAVCGGPITYAGRGRKPEYCSPECRRKDRTEYRRDLRRARRHSAPALSPEASAALAAWRARPRVAVKRADDDHLLAVGDLAAAYPGTDGRRDGWTDRFVGDNDWRRKVARRDPAREWLAAHFPEELEFFGPNTDDGVTVSQ